MVKSVAADCWMWEQASTNRLVVWPKSCIAWQKFGATEQRAGDNNLQKWGTATIGQEMGTACSISPWNPHVMKSNSSMSYQPRGCLVKQAPGYGHNSLVTTSIAREEEEQQQQRKWLLEATNPCYIRTWNVQTLHGEGNKDILLHQLRGYNWHVIGLAETHITGKGEYDMEEGIKLIYSGEEEGGEAWHGVGFLLNRKTAEALIASHLISACIISIQLNCQAWKLPSSKCVTQLLTPVMMKATVFTMTYKLHSTAFQKRIKSSFWETSMLRLVFTSPYGKIPWATLVLAI